METKRVARRLGFLLCLAAILAWGCSTGKYGVDSQPFAPTEYVTTEKGDRFEIPQSVVNQYHGPPMATPPRDLTGGQYVPVQLPSGGWIVIPNQALIDNAFTVVPGKKPPVTAQPPGPGKPGDDCTDHHGTAQPKAAAGGAAGSQRKSSAASLDTAKPPGQAGSKPAGMTPPPASAAGAATSKPAATAATPPKAAATMPKGAQASGAPATGRPAGITKVPPSPKSGPVKAAKTGPAGAKAAKAGPAGVAAAPRPAAAAKAGAAGRPATAPAPRPAPATVKKGQAVTTTPIW
jgi:hypothetical protein